MKKRIMTAGLLAALSIGGAYAIAHYARSTTAPRAAPVNKVQVPVPDSAGARDAVTASKIRLRAKLEDEQHPEHAKAVEFVKASEEAAKKLESLGAVATGPSTVTELKQQFESAIAAVETVRAQAEVVDPESKSFWDQLWDALQWIFKNVLLPLFLEWVKSQGGDSGHTDKGGTGARTLADSTLVGTSDGGRLMLAMGGKAISLEPPAEGRAVGVLNGSVDTFPLIVEWQRPDGSRLTYEYASENSIPVIRHGK